jgi:hypothetical protein
LSAGYSIEAIDFKREFEILEAALRGDLTGLGGLGRADSNRFSTTMPA